LSQPEIAKKSIKPPIFAFKVIKFGANREPVYDFLLVINSNLARPHLAPLLRYVQQLIGQKSPICPPPSYLAPSFVVTPFEFVEKLYGSWN